MLDQHWATVDKGALFITTLPILGQYHFAAWDIYQHDVLGYFLPGVVNFYMWTKKLCYDTFHSLTIPFHIFLLMLAIRKKKYISYG